MYSTKNDKWAYFAGKEKWRIYELDIRKGKKKIHINQIPFVIFSHASF